jgi:hypothetical protein
MRPMTNLIDLGEALDGELTACGGELPISCRITRDGTRQHDGWIDVSTSREGALVAADTMHCQNFRRHIW